MEELNSRAEMEMRKAGEELMRKAKARKEEKEAFMNEEADPEVIAKIQQAQAEGRAKRD